MVMGVMGVTATEAMDMAVMGMAVTAVTAVTKKATKKALAVVVMMVVVVTNDLPLAETREPHRDRASKNHDGYEARYDSVGKYLSEHWVLCSGQGSEPHKRLKGSWNAYLDCSFVYGFGY